MATAAAVSTATGCAGTALSEAFSYLWKKVVEEVKMLICLPRAITQMKEKVEDLESNMDDINAELGQEQRRPKRIVETWLQGARGAIESSRSIGLKYEAYQQHKNCLGCCTNCLSRYRISRDVREWEQNVDQLDSEKQSKLPPSGQYGDPTPRAQIPIQSTQSGIVASAKRSEDMKLLVTWLTAEDSNIRRIGIQGMGGVGKTSLLDAINDSEEVRNSFQLIVKVTVSKNNILDLQKSVADRLNLTLPDNFEVRKDMLRSSLKNKKYIILLDDMWEEDMWTSQKLQNLGVSLDDTGFKIVLTTRDKRVCKRMNVQETITVEPLSEDYGWQLFRSRAFENLNGNVPPELEEVARKIAKECKGLPLAIIVVAAAMTPHTDVHEWDAALTQLQNVDETFYAVNPGVDTELFQRLKWSYNALNSHKLQTCFLYFAAFPEDEEIDSNDVIDKWIAEGIVEGNEGSYLHDNGYSYMSHLRDRCLIEVVHTDKFGRIGNVKIHDILRDLAIRIAEKEHSCYFKAGQGVSHFPVDHQGWAKMSLMYNRLHSLPTTFACSSLTVLLLNKNRDIKEVPESFLRELPSLKVLDLSETGITSLPPSIGNLKHLAYLRLQGCDGICELPETIGDLNNLQFLNVSECPQLLCLPERISELKRLTSLDLSESGLSHLPRGISELVSLERLEMYGSNISLDFEEDANAETKNVCFKDLQSLRRLRSLSVEIKSPVKEGIMGNWSKMRYLLMRYQYDLPRDMQAMKHLEGFWLRGCDVERLPSWVSEFRKLAFLQLSECMQLKELHAELQELPCLRRLDIWYCDELKELELGMGFPKLEVLTLIKLGSLECVRAGTAASGSEGRPSPLPMLKSLHIEGGCEKLKRLSGEWDKLKCLERIEGSREWWDAIEWEDPNIKTSLESKFRGW